jgi:hypothetical protein
MSDEATLICKICGHQNPASAKLCVRCQSVLQPETRRIEQTEELEAQLKHGTRHLEKRLFLHIHGANEFIEVQLEEGKDIILGRFDPLTGKAPEVDLSNHGAADKGVSRRHAMLTYKNGSLRLSDLNSPNFTFLNNQKLIPNQSRMLRDGDEIRLGRLVVTVQFGERTLEKPSA